MSVVPFKSPLEPLAMKERLISRKVMLRDGMERDPVVLARKRLRNLRDPFNRPLKIHAIGAGGHSPPPLSPAERTRGSRIAKIVLALHLGLGR